MHLEAGYTWFHYRGCSESLLVMLVNIICWWKKYVSEEFSVFWWKYQHTISYIFTNKILEHTVCYLPLRGSLHSKSFLFKLISFAEIDGWVWALCMFLVEKLLLIFNISCLFVFVNHFLLVSFQALSGFEKISDSSEILIQGL